MRRYLIAGLLVWVPLVITGLVLKILVDVLKWFLQLLPGTIRPDALLGLDAPGIGIAIMLTVVVIIVLVTGVIVANIFGRQLVNAWESLLGRIPFVRTIYTSAKQVSETILSSQGKSFRKVLLIEYPRKGLWTLCFQTGSSVGEVQAKTGEEVVTVFVPTTPNPTSGFIILVPRKDVIELEMSVDVALKMVISLGVLEPQWKGANSGSSIPASDVAQNGPNA